MENDSMIKIFNISKMFSGTKALQSVSFEIKKGAVHCIVGQNGAGKSTLIKILAGLISPDDGAIYINDKEVKINGVYDAAKYGLSFIFQERSIINSLNITENICLGREKRKSGFLYRSEDERKVRDYFKEFNILLNPNTVAGTLSVAKKQLVEIIRAVMYGASVVLMDEPTSSLSQTELDYLFKMIDKLKSNGITIIYISHNLEDVFKIGDYVTVLRDGREIATKKTTETNQKEIISMMIGQELDSRFPDKIKPNEVEDVILLKNINTDLLKSIDLVIKKGEVCGILGLEGSGKTELARIIYGLDSAGTGEIIIKRRSPQDKRASRNCKVISLVPEDRISEGIVPKLSVEDNVSLSIYDEVTKFGLLQRLQIKRRVLEWVKKLRVKCQSISQEVQYLSGGNQQKVVLAKALNSNPSVLLLDEPTNGIDIGAKFEIYKTIQEIANNRGAVVVFSSDIDEIVSLCHRVILLKEGKIAGEFRGNQICRKNILELMLEA